MTSVSLGAMRIVAALSTKNILLYRRLTALGGNKNISAIGVGYRREFVEEKKNPPPVQNGWDVR